MTGHRMVVANFAGPNPADAKRNGKRKEGNGGGKKNIVRFIGLAAAIENSIIPVTGVNAAE